VPEILQDFINYLRSCGLNKNSVRNYLVDINKFCAWFQVKTGHPLEAHSFSPAYVNFFFNELASDIPASTLHRYRTSLNKFSSWLKPTLPSDISGHSPAISTPQDTSDHSDISKSDTYLNQFSQHLSQRGLHRLSVRNYLADIQKFFVWFEMEKGQKLSAENFYPELIDQYQEELNLKGVPEATTKRYLISLRHFYHFLHPDEILPITPKPYQKITKRIKVSPINSFNQHPLIYYLTPKLMSILASVFILFIFSSVAGVRYFHMVFRPSDKSVNIDKNISLDSDHVSLESIHNGKVLASQTEKELLEINLDTNINSSLFVSGEASIAGLLSAPGGIVTSDLEAYLSAVKHQ